MHDRDRGLSTLRTVEVPLEENDNQAIDTSSAETGGETRRSERPSRSYQGRSGGRGGRSDDRGRGGRSDDRGRGGESDDRDRGDESDDRGRGRGRGSQGGSRGRPMGGRRGKKVCTFCADKITAIDYKDVNLLRNFVSEHGKIKARRRTGTCAKHQRRLALAIKRARHLAFLPYSAEHSRGR